MKFINSLALIIVASINLAFSRRVHSKTSSAFMSTCRKVKLSGSNLSAECERNNKSWMKTSVDLSTCVTNNNGNLQKGGAYDRSCSGCKLESSSLSCKYKNKRGSNKSTKFDLNTFIANKDGVFYGCGQATSSLLLIQTLILEVLEMDLDQAQAHL